MAIRFSAEMKIESNVIESDWVRLYVTEMKSYPGDKTRPGMKKFLLN